MVHSWQKVGSFNVRQDLSVWPSLASEQQHSGNRLESQDYRGVPLSHILRGSFKLHAFF